MLVIIIYAVIILPIMVVCIYLGQLIARGEGDSLIAGYNTAKKEERERYDIGRLRRLSSMAMYATAALLPLFGVASTLPGQWAKVAILALAAILCLGTIVCITWGDKWSRKQ